MFEHTTNYSLTQLTIREDSPWLGKTISSLKLHNNFSAGAIGIRYDNSSYGYAPNDQYILQEDEVLIVVAPSDNIQALQVACAGTTHKTRFAVWQPIPIQHPPLRSEQTYSLVEAEKAISSIMKNSDALRDDAHGGTLRAPTTLRSKVLQSASFTPDEIQALLKQGRKTPKN